MKYATLFIFVLSSHLLNAAEPVFKKREIKPTNVLSEIKSANIGVDKDVQNARARSPEFIKAMIGSSLGATEISPSVQAEWSRRIKSDSRIFAGAGIAYSAETVRLSDGQPRNRHELPIFALIGADAQLVKNTRASIAAGPVVRQIFERGFTLEQNTNYSYGDAMAEANFAYEWIEPLTNSGRQVGLTWVHMFGLPNQTIAPSQNSLLAFFGFDL